MGRPFVLASLVATLALAPALAGDTKEGLGWKFSKGEKLRYGVAYNLEMKIEIMGMAQNIRQNARLELTQETKDIKDGTASIEATLDRVQIEVEIPAFPGMKGGKVAYDSSEKEEKKDEKKKKADDDEEDEGAGPGMGMGLTKEAFKGLKDIVGSKFTFKIARDGTISDLSGVEEIAEKAMAGLGPAGAMAGAGAGAAFPLLDPEVLQQTLDLHCHVFPSGDAGESWEIPTKVQIPSIGTMEFKRKITPKGEDKLAHTANKPELKPGNAPAGGNPMMAQLGKPKIKDPGYEGSSTISRADGRVVSDELVATVTNEMSMKMPGGKGGGMGGGDDEEDEDAPKKKDDKKGEKKDDKKKSDDEEEDDDAPKGGMKFLQKFKLVMKYELLDGKASEKPADKKPADKKSEPE